MIIATTALAAAGPLAAVAAGSGNPGSGGGGLGPTTTTSNPATTAPGGTTTGTSTSYAPPPTISPGPRGNPLTSRGMWIWVLSATDGGNLSQIISDAHALGVRTLMIKSGDGAGMWSQFNPSVVSALHAAHLHVCAWQFVYGDQPGAEAQVGAQAVRDGADCLVIDAESQYEGKYVQAQTYIQDLRKLIGYSYPVALAGFPYIDYHPAFPYSVFLGRGGAQFNTPQMYWKDIGTSVPAVYAHTYEFNEVYQRPIEPLGQIYDAPPAGQVRQFRAVSRYYGATGISWWDWQSASPGAWRAVAQPAGRIANFVPYTTAASIGLHALGDLVVWAQEHLVAAGQQISIDGDFGPATQSAVENFQTQHGLPVTGVIDAPTWAALLRYRPVAVKWVKHKKGGQSAVLASIRSAASYHRGAPLTLGVPVSAHARARRDELAGAGGAGSPAHPS
jgi:hypothetical protein